MKLRYFMQCIHAHTHAHQKILAKRALVITLYPIQNDQYFHIFSYFSSEMAAKYEKRGKYKPYCLR